MRTSKNCSICSAKNSIVNIHYYDETGTWKTEPIAFCLCKSCFRPFRFDKLPFKNDIHVLQICIGSNDDADQFADIERAKGKISCIYCGSSDGRLVKLFIKNRQTKSNRKQVGYLCGTCNHVYFNNKKMILTQSASWHEIPVKLPPTNHRYDVEEQTKLQRAYERLSELNKNLSDGKYKQNEMENIKKRILELEQQTKIFNHTKIYSLYGATTSEGAPI